MSSELKTNLNIWCFLVGGKKNLFLHTTVNMVAFLTLEKQWDLSFPVLKAKVALKTLEKQWNDMLILHQRKHAPFVSVIVEVSC